ncbi:MAG: hypothetical protein ABI672_05145 [Vicinamibacteria bacterium]
METQISALVSTSTRDLLDRHSRRTGIKKSRLIEDAIRHHLAALSEFPEEFVIPTRLVVSDDDFKKLKGGTRQGRPNAALRDLMRGR